MIDDINEGKVNNVLVFKVDRLTRSTRNLLELVELFEEKNCAFNSLTESIDTDTPSGRMFLKIIGIFAEFERENLVSRLKLGFERKAKEGYTLANNHISYGYSKEKGQKIQQIIPEEAKIVKEIFSMYLDKNMSMNQIAKALNQRKIPTKQNVTWARLTIKGILTNPTYIGKVRYSLQDTAKYFEADGHHERLISDDIFNQAQEKIRNTPQISRTKRAKDQSYFCGVLTCGMCGGKFTTHNYTNKAGANRSSYRCMKKIYTNVEETCTSPEISHDKVEVAFNEYIQHIGDFSEADNITVDDNKAQKERELLAYIVDCEKRIENLNARKKKVTEQYMGEEISFEEYRSMTDIFNEKYATLDGELDRAKAEISVESNAPNVAKEDIILNLKENWDYLDNKERMIFLQRFVKKIVVKVQKEHEKSNTVRIQDIEFNLGESIEKSKRKSVRNSLIR